MDLTSSVEKVIVPKNHDVVGEGHQSQVALLAPIAAAFDVGALTAFDHRHHRFDL